MGVPGMAVVWLSVLLMPKKANDVSVVASVAVVMGFVFEILAGTVILAMFVNALSAFPLILPVSVSVMLLPTVIFAVANTALPLMDAAQLEPLDAAQLAPIFRIALGTTSLTPTPVAFAGPVLVTTTV